MNNEDYEDRVYAFIRVALQNLPSFGDISLVLYCSDSKISRLVTSRSESIKFAPAKKRMSLI
jgi:hypothetical protein